MKTCHDCKHFQWDNDWCEKWETYFDENEDKCDEFEEKVVKNLSKGKIMEITHFDTHWTGIHVYRQDEGDGHVYFFIVADDGYESDAMTHYPTKAEIDEIREIVKTDRG